MPALPPRHRSFAPLAIALTAAVLATAAPVALAQRNAAKPTSPDARHLRTLSWRSIGPANCGGRVSAIAMVEGSPSSFYVGFGTGGVFKTENFGTTWTALFDDQPVASIGSIALWPGNPKVVWVGTGEANSRNSSSWGNGVYKSLDGGSTWQHLGLEATHNIARVIAHPTDSSVAWVAALGRLWGTNPERGVFRTSDGGRTWQHTLKADANTGAVDLVIDPNDPNVLYAAMYARLRTPWSYTAGGTTGGVFRSRDGGRSWTKLTNGLPADCGRIGLDVYRKDPKVVFALIESNEGGQIDSFEEKSRTGGVFRSTDGGDTWERLSPYTPRMFYFAQIRVEPDDSSRVYVLGTDLWVSDDGGRTFRARGARNLHPDCHDLRLSADGNLAILGTDGGMYVSHDRAKTWDFPNNLATGEFYNVGVDMGWPYKVYGGLQDNQTWGGPSRTLYRIDAWFDAPTRDGILNDHWECLGGGDGFHVAVDPTNPDIVYFESQRGNLVRVDRAGGRERFLRPTAEEGEPAYRFNWNTPFQISPHDPTVLWMGGNHLFRLDERGDRWSRVSPDLTTQDPKKMVSAGSGAETHCTIVTLSESPVRAGTIWVGTDDGKVWITPDGGTTWTDLTRNLRTPAGLYVSRIEASHHDANTAYVSIDGHRTNVFAPYVLATRDGGRSWQSIVGNLPKDGPVKVVREDPVNPDLLYAGTEFGFWMSLDRGRSWIEHREGLPRVAVDDIVVHPRERDVVIGTHGRSVYVLDDVTALQGWSAKALEDTLTLFPPRDAMAFHTRYLGATWGQRMWRAKNPEFGAGLSYYLPRDLEKGEVSLTIADSLGRTVRTLTGPGRAGLHRVMWELQAGKPDERIDRPEWENQPLFVPEGRYTVTATAGRAAPRKVELRVRHYPGTQDGIH